MSKLYTVVQGITSTLERRFSSNEPKPSSTNLDLSGGYDSFLAYRSGSHKKTDISALRSGFEDKTDEGNFLPYGYESFQESEPSIAASICEAIVLNPNDEEKRSTLIAAYKPFGITMPSHFAWYVALSFSGELHELAIGQQKVSRWRVKPDKREQYKNRASNLLVDLNTPFIRYLVIPKSGESYPRTNRPSYERVIGAMFGILNNTDGYEVSLEELANFNVTGEKYLLLMEDIERYRHKGLGIRTLVRSLLT